MRQEIHGTNSVTYFENAAEIIEELELNLSSNQHIRGKVIRRNNESPMHYMGFPTYSKLKDAIRHGWPEACRRTEGIHVEGLPQIKGIVRRKKRSDFGDEVDIQAVYSGDLDTAWTTFEHVVSENIGYNNITIIVNLATSGGVDASRAFWKGAAATILCDNLVKMGKAVEIVATNYGTNTCGGNVPNNMNVIPVKGFNYPLDKEHVNAVLSPGFHRGFVHLAIIKSADMKGATAREGLGTPAEPSDKLLAEVFPNRRIMYVPHTIQDSGACETFLKNTLTKLIEGN